MFFRTCASQPLSGALVPDALAGAVRATGSPVCAFGEARGRVAAPAAGTWANRRTPRSSKMTRRIGGLPEAQTLTVCAVCNSPLGGRQLALKYHAALLAAGNGSAGWSGAMEAR